MTDIYVGEGLPSFPIYTYTISRRYLLLTQEEENMYLDVIAFSEDSTDFKDNKLITTSGFTEADGRELSLSTLSSKAIKVMRTEGSMKWVKQVNKETFFHLLGKYKGNLLAVHKNVVESAIAELMWKEGEPIFPVHLVRKVQQ